MKATVPWFTVELFVGDVITGAGTVAAWVFTVKVTGAESVELPAVSVSVAIMVTEPSGNSVVGVHVQ